MTDPKPTSRRDGTAAHPETPHRRPLGQWLVETMPRGANLDPPGGRKSDRKVPFVDGEAE